MLHLLKKQEDPKYEHKTEKLDQKDNQFTSKKFHKIRKDSTRKIMLKSLGKIGLCLNDRDITDIPKTDLDKVCFILINDCDKELGVGPINDGYLIALNHKKMGYKVYYLYNALYLEFISFIWYFLDNTSDALTIFYSGKNKNGEGIDFSDTLLTKSSLNDVIVSNCNGKARVMFITDSLNGGSVFDIKGAKNVISFYVRKSSLCDNKQNKRSHGIFTYYFCKLTNECSTITPLELTEKMDDLLSRFEEVLEFDTTSEELGENPIF